MGLDRIQIADIVDVAAHWAKRGGPRAANEPLEPSPLEPSPLELELDTTSRG